jgi:hypothetical protein
MVDVPLSSGVLNVTADVPAEVRLNGEPIGRTPTGNVSVPIGEHEVLVSHPRFGEQRLVVLVGLGAPTRLAIVLGTPANPGGRYRGSPNRSGISAAR